MAFSRKDAADAMGERQDAMIDEKAEKMREKA